MLARRFRMQAGTLARLVFVIVAGVLFAWGAVALGRGADPPPGAGPQPDRSDQTPADGGDAVRERAARIRLLRSEAEHRRHSAERRRQEQERRLLASQRDEAFPRRPSLPPPGYERSYVPIGPGADPQAYPQVRYRPSQALGLPFAGRLRGGTLLPREGPDFTTWDPILKSYPNRPWRRVGTSRLVRLLLSVTARYRDRDPGAPRIVVGDLSLPGGGPFGREYGSLGHASHQNGLDIDVYLPRSDRAERAPRDASQVDRRRSQTLIDLFIAAGAEKVFVTDPRFRGPRSVLQAIPLHDRHMHVRMHPGPDDRPGAGTPRSGS